jgi:hypothetical protein
MVGTLTTVNSINQSAGQAALNLRNACQAILNLQEYITTIGTSGLETIGFTADDAATLITAINYMNTIAEVFEGTVPQTPAFNFDNAISVLYGAQ